MLVYQRVSSPGDLASLPRKGEGSYNMSFFPCTLRFFSNIADIAAKKISPVHLLGEMRIVILQKDYLYMGILG